jgi:hypothetical protein
MLLVVRVNTRAVICHTNGVAYDVKVDSSLVNLLEPIHCVINQVDEDRINSMAEIFDL